MALQFVKFSPASLALFNRKANTADNVLPVWSEPGVYLEVHKETFGVSIPVIPTGTFMLKGVEGGILACGRGVVWDAATLMDWVSVWTPVWEILVVVVLDGVVERR